MRPRIIHLETVQSTNGFLAEELRKSSPHRELVVIADYQESGKGQGDNRWESPRGENLLMSILLFPEFLSASGQFQLSRMASLAIVDTLKNEKLTPVIKWPNDILSGGRKIAGILIENGITGTVISHSIVGIGLNLNQKEFPEFPLSATSMLLETGRQSVLRQMADGLIDTLMARYGQLESGSVDVLEREYQEHLFCVDLPCDFMYGGAVFTGIIRGVNEFGELLVERDGKTGSYGFQEISYRIGA